MQEEEDDYKYLQKYFQKREENKGKARPSPESVSAVGYCHRTLEMVIKIMVLA